MSKHRASNRNSVSRLMPLGAGMTVALLAAGTGSAFAAPTVAAPAPSAACTEATNALGLKQGEVTTATAERDKARGTLRDARAVVAKAQERHDSALRNRDAAQKRVDSLTVQQAAKKVALDNAKSRAATNPSRSAQRDLARATAAFAAAQRATDAANANLVTKQGLLTNAPGATSEQRGNVTAAITKLNKAEGALATLKGERRTARDVRDAACSGVTTLG